MDHSLPDEVQKQIIATIEQASPRINGYHCLRTRVSGKMTFIDVHIVFDHEISLFDAHTVADSIEKKLESDISGAIVTIHLDPYDDSKKMDEKHFE
jgi:divalent metal cation (Fe/Co/Zn/Cd) transporter